MDKISGILPASARTSVADISSAQPARPGAPALGRPMGRNSLGDRVTLSKQLEEMRMTGQMQEEAPVTYKNPAEAKKIKVVDDLNKKFFTDPKALAEKQQTTSEEFLKRTEEAPSMFVVEDDLKPQAALNPVSSTPQETSPAQS